MEKVARNIKKFRELRDFTQDYMADMLQISQSHYNRMEKGDVKVTGEIVDKVSKILDVSPEALYTFDDKGILQNGNNNTLNSYQFNEHVNIYPIDKKLEKLYEDKIRMLEDEIKRLKSRVQ